MLMAPLGLLSSQKSLCGMAPIDTNTFCCLSLLVLSHEKYSVPDQPEVISCWATFSISLLLHGCVAVAACITASLPHQAAKYVTQSWATLLDHDCISPEGQSNTVRQCVYVAHFGMKRRPKLFMVMQVWFIQQRETVYDNSSLSVAPCCVGYSGKLSKHATTCIGCDCSCDCNKLLSHHIAAPMKTPPGA